MEASADVEVDSSEEDRRWVKNLGQGVNGSDLGCDLICARV